MSATMLGRLVRAARGSTPEPDGQAVALQPVPPDAAAAQPARPGHRPIAHPDTIIAAALAQKLLHGWLQNRYQTRYPLVLKLGNQSAEEVALLMQTVRCALRMVAASEADERRAAAWLASVGGALELQGGADEALPVAGLMQARLAPHAYAASAGALGRRTVATRRFLHFLAARLGIPDDVARSLNRRFAR